MISKPNKIFKIFGSLATRGVYTMTGFGSLNPVSDWNEIATQCYEEGFESVDSNFHLKDLQLILNYMSHGIAYLYQQGIPEWNKYQSYPLGAVTQYKGKLYLNIGEVTGQSLPKSNCCGCECEEDSTVETPDVDKQHWEEIVTMKELDKLKETFSKLPSKFAEKQSDGTIKFTNPDGTTLITEYPINRIGSNGNWFINDVDTGRKAIGEKGERGERGEKGDRGDKGERGQDGTNGHDGVDGKDGINGTNGVDGTNGKSAYELAVDNGFTGTEPEWLASLKGQKGDKGATGAQGLKGDKGDKGDKGEKGERGSDGGLDCASIANLPLAKWEEGTSILATQDGQCKRLVPIANIFQEMGVSIFSTKLNGLINEIYKLTVTVTNSGEAENEVTDLVITKPQLGNYQTVNFNTSVSTGGAIEKVNDFNYKIKKLKSGGSVQIEFDVIPSSKGTLQFGASINPNTILDQQSNNNTASITLSVQEPQSNEEVTRECPLISAKWDNKDLLVNQLNKNWYSGSSTYIGALDNRVNIFAKKRHIKDVRLKLNNVGSVFIYAFLDNILKQPIVTDNGTASYGAEIHKGYQQEPAESYIFDPNTGELVFKKELKGVMIVLNPKSNKCNSQVIYLAASKIIQNYAEFQYSLQGTQTFEIIMYNKKVIQAVNNTNLVLDGETRGWIQTVNTWDDIKNIPFLKVRVPKDSKSYTITYVPKNTNKTTNYFVGAHQQGNLTVNGSGNVLTISANADALPTDTFKFKEVIIEVV